MSEVLYRVGTLEYTKRGLIVLFFWLLWGDFCFCLMESVFPSVVPLTMYGLHASAKLIGVVMVTIPATLNFIVCPWISFKSDRHRSKWGRRIPFILFTAPWLVMALILMGFSSDIGSILHRTLFSATALSKTTITLGLIAVLVVIFQYFNMFVASVFYYLFNDVVPDEFLGRFMALFRVVGSIAGAFFSFFIMRYAEIYTKWIFLGAGLLYLVVFSFMCLKVKEGEYPPPPENVDKKVGIIASAKTFFVECFSHPFYWVFFLAATCWELTSNCLNPFVILFQTKSLGIPLILKSAGDISFHAFRLASWTGKIHMLGHVFGWGTIGCMGGIGALVGAMILYPMGMLSDRKHPVRTVLLALGGICLLTPIRFIYLFHNFTPTQAYYIEFAWSMLTLPLSCLYAASIIPLFMRMLPAERYGQFCSAQAMFRSLCVILSGFLVGWIIDSLKTVSMSHGMNADFCYRFVPVMMWVCQLGAFLFMIRVYGYFKEFGGDEAYQPPETPVLCPNDQEVGVTG
jgi:MFS family permease